MNLPTSRAILLATTVGILAFSACSADTSAAPDAPSKDAASASASDESAAQHAADRDDAMAEFGIDINDHDWDVEKPTVDPGLNSLFTGPVLDEMRDFGKTYMTTIAWDPTNMLADEAKEADLKLLRPYLTERTWKEVNATLADLRREDEDPSYKSKHSYAEVQNYNGYHLSNEDSFISVGTKDDVLLDPRITDITYKAYDYDQTVELHATFDFTVYIDPTVMKRLKQRVLNRRGKFEGLPGQNARTTALTTTIGRSYYLYKANPTVGWKVFGAYTDDADLRAIELPGNPMVDEEAS